MRQTFAPLTGFNVSIPPKYRPRGRHVLRVEMWVPAGKTVAGRTAGFETIVYRYSTVSVPCKPRIIAISERSGALLSLDCTGLGPCIFTRRLDVYYHLLCYRYLLTFGLVSSTFLCGGRAARSWFDSGRYARSSINVHDMTGNQTSDEPANQEYFPRLYACGFTLTKPASSKSA